MSDLAIRVEGISKLYRIGQTEAYKALRDTLAEALYSPFRYVSSIFGLSAANGGKIPYNYIWALKDVSFEVKRGEVLGLIGHNGAGKSTMLKILARITDPTEGWAQIHGHATALLEVGTGFHPELTGRENVYLNGVIMGMSRSDIKRKFDEIVSFAEVERFIDTPVKRYSSGMAVRLGFAVAAHLEPVILLVDEVLAVGDAAFQRKCLGKMDRLAHGQHLIKFRTVVSQRIHVHAYFPFQRTDPNVQFSEYFKLAEYSRYFHLEQQVSFDQLLMLLTQYDWGFYHHTLSRPSPILH